MDYAALIDDIQRHVFSLQERLDQLRSMSAEQAPSDILLTRQQAADLIGKSLRQLDRDCRIHHIRKENVNGGVRIRKSELMRYMGLIGEELPQLGESAISKILNRRLL